MDYPKKWKCPNCSAMVENNKVCPECGFKFGTHYPKLWSCPNCSNINSDSEFCKACDYPNVLSYPKLWHCHECKNLVKDSAKCEECGFEIIEKKEEKPAEAVIEKKVSKKEFLDKKNIYLFSVGVIILCLVLVFYSLDFSATNTQGFDAYSGQEFTKDFTLASNLDRVVFDMTSPKGEAVSVQGVKKSGSIWQMKDVTLNESGEWIIKITGTAGLSSLQIYGSIIVKEQCINESCAI